RPATADQSPDRSPVTNAPAPSPRRCSARGRAEKQCRRRPRRTHCRRSDDPQEILFRPLLPTTWRTTSPKPLLRLLTYAPRRPLICQDVQSLLDLYLCQERTQQHVKDYTHETTYTVGV